MEADGFEWDDAKAASNFRKHGVTFGEAATVFDDPLAVTLARPGPLDRRGPVPDDRPVDGGRILVVSHTDRGDRIRIISAREATRREQKGYEDGTFP